jgi:hypothetical protein
LESSLDCSSITVGCLLLSDTSDIFNPEILGFIDNEIKTMTQQLKKFVISSK